MSDRRSDSEFLECDLVMRGGVTSGIVYPKTVAELAKSYRFRSIGGTSAGAIGAAITAAAEFGRRQILAAGGSKEEAQKPFDFVGRLPEELSRRSAKDKTKLLRLFQPQKATEPLFRIFLAATEAVGVRGMTENSDGKPIGNEFEDRALKIAKGVIRAFPVSSFLGALPGLILGLSIVAGLSRPFWVKRSVTAALEGHVPGFTVFGLAPLDALGWIGSSTAVMSVMFAMSVVGLWWSKRGFTALAVLVFVLPLGLILQTHYLGLLGQSLSGADNFSVFSINFGLVIAQLSALVGSLLTSSIMAGRRASTALPGNMYGICSGMTVDRFCDSPGVTDWLHHVIQGVAGRKLQEKPLTAGDLWHPLGVIGGGNVSELPRDIELSLMVTNVTRGISHRFPFMEGWRGSLYFRLTDFVRLFPRPVVEHMVRHAQPVERDVHLEKGYFRLPPAEELPILFGARMSMAYPFLLSAIPLYAVDWACQGEDGKFRLRRSWFSDGGLTSNFPINLFDRPLPSRPTFGINLVPDTARHFEVALEETVDGGVRKINPEAFDFQGRVEKLQNVRKAKPGIGNGGHGWPTDRNRQDEDPWDDIWMPRRNDQDLFKVIRFNDFEKSGGSIAGFFAALFDTARNWADTELTHMPGYRDRIVHVELKPDEGGLNLNMPEGVIRKVGRKGELAGRLLAARFHPNPGHDPQSEEEIELGWENHRWVRYRSTMAALEHVARDLVLRLREDLSHRDVKSYREMLDDSLETTSLYRWASREQYLFALQATGDLTRFVSQWMREYETFDRVRGDRNPTHEGLSPRPKATFKITPPSDSDPLQERMRTF